MQLEESNFIFCYLAKYSNVAGKLHIDMNGAVTILTGSLNSPLDETSYNLNLGKNIIFSQILQKYVDVITQFNEQL